MSRLLLVLGVALGLIGNLISASNAQFDSLTTPVATACENCACGGDCCVTDASSESADTLIAAMNLRSASEIQSLQVKVREFALFESTRAEIQGTCFVDLKVSFTPVPIFLSLQVILI